MNTQQRTKEWRGGFGLAVQGKLFERVRDAYDLGHLAQCRVVAIGVGGAAAFVEDLTRAGVGQLVLVDPDVVSETNVATQQTYLRDVGRPKVDCLRDRLLDINPDAIVEVRQQALDEGFDDATFEQLALAPLDGPKPAVVLVCGLTDNFYAQARVNRLALQFGLPSLCAGLYSEGRCAEITFTYPRVTPACHRCILSSRYAAYLEQEFKNDVTSHGSPIFSTTRLNALKGAIAMALLHHPTDHPRWGALLQRIGNRNLVQIRMDPDLATTLGFTVFDRVFGPGDRERILMDEAVWLPQEPEGDCPECHGTGDLCNAIGAFTDTRLMPQKGNV